MTQELQNNARTGTAALQRVLASSEGEIQKVAEKGTDLSRLFTLVRSTMASDVNLSAVLSTREGVISAATATTTLAQLGLEPTGRAGGAYLVAYNCNVGDRDNPIWRQLVQVIPDWRAYLRWAVRDGLADDIMPRAVHEGDTFDVSMDPATGNEVVRHSYDPFGERGKRIGYYVTFVKAGMAPRYEFMPMAEIQKRRAIAKTKKVWDAWPEEMERKTVIRWAIDRRLPLGAQKLADLMAADDATVTIDATAKGRQAPVLDLAADVPEGRRVTLSLSAHEPPQQAPGRTEAPAGTDTPAEPETADSGDEGAQDGAKANYRDEQPDAPTPWCPECSNMDNVTPAPKATKNGNMICAGPDHPAGGLRFFRARAADLSALWTKAEAALDTEAFGAWSDQVARHMPPENAQWAAEHVDMAEVWIDEVAPEGQQSLA